VNATASGSTGYRAATQTLDCSHLRMAFNHARLKSRLVKLALPGIYILLGTITGVDFTLATPCIHLTVE